MSAPKPPRFSLRMAAIFALAGIIALLAGHNALSQVAGGRQSGADAQIAFDNASALTTRFDDQMLRTKGQVEEPAIWFAAAQNALRANPLSPGAVRVLIDLGVVAFSGGMFIVPLYAILQLHSPPGERSRIIAANNIVNAAVAVLCVLAIAGLLALGVTVPGLIGALGFATLAIACASFWLLPGTPFSRSGA